MKKTVSSILISILLMLSVSVFAQKGSYGDTKQRQSPQSPRLGFIIHGGAGVIKRGSLTPEKEAEYRKETRRSRNDRI